MSLNRPEAQQNPDLGVYDIDAEQFYAGVRRRVQALDEHRFSIHRWFWKALLAFNLVLWSLAFAIAFVLYVS